MRHFGVSQDFAIFKFSIKLQFWMKQKREDMTKTYCQNDQQFKWPTFCFYDCRQLKYIFLIYLPQKGEEFPHLIFQFVWAWNQSSSGVGSSLTFQQTEKFPSPWGFYCKHNRNRWILLNTTISLLSCFEILLDSRVI